jgi:hypothetical protein
MTTHERHPAADAAELVRDVVSSVAVEVARRAGSPQVLSRKLARAEVALSRLLSDGQTDPIVLFDGAASAIAEAVASLSALRQEGLARRLELATRHFAERRSASMDGWSRHAERATASLPPFVVSGSGPSWHRLSRTAPLGFEAPPAQELEDLPDPDAIRGRLEADFAALREGRSTGDEVPSEGPATELVTLRPPEVGRDIDVAGRAGELAQLRRVAEDCLQEIGAMGQLRDVAGDEPWHEGVLRSERRLLAAYDAAAALGRGRLRIDLVDETVRWERDGLTEDPFRAFAHAFVLGSVAVPGAARAAAVSMLSSKPDVARARAHGLALAAGEEVDATLSFVCAEADPPAVVSALWAMRVRGHAPAATLAPLSSHPDDEVRLAAARCLAVCPDRASVDALTRALLLDDSDRVVTTALTVLLVRDRERALQELRQRIDADLDEPGQLSRAARREVLMLIALAAEKKDFARLAQAIARQPSACEVLGWLGTARAVHTLLDIFEQGTADAQAVAALDRITGLAAPAAGDSSVWKKWLSERPDDDSRWRWGRAHRVDAIARELGAWRVPMVVRERLWVELGVAIGRFGPSPSTWVEPQLAWLAALAREGPTDA